MPILVAPDAFKGTFRAPQVAAAIGRGLEAAGLTVDLCPMADGGEGTIEVLLPRLGGEVVAARARSPLGRTLSVGFGLVEDGATALVEVAAASGMGLDPPDPLNGTTHGTGELIAAAVEAGASVVLVAAGGSATVDGGRGAIEVLREVGLEDVRLVVLCDVRTPWERAAATFGPQKGASPEDVVELAARLDELAASLPRDPRGVPATGAAGGLSGGLWAAFGAVLEPGAAFVAEALEIDERLAAASGLIVGEGRVDATSLEGKVLGELASRARAAGVPCAAVVGQDGLAPGEAGALGLRAVVEATDLAAMERAGFELGRTLGSA